MKASKKLILVSAATIMLTVPVLANNHLSNPVAAASQDNTQTTKLTFYINHNAYVYNHQGKRTKSKIKKGKLLKVTILKPKAITNPNQSRYFFNNVLAGKYFSLPTVSIKKTDFVNIGKNKYIKPGNIGRISPGKYQYADLSTKEIKVITKKTAPVTNQIGMPIAAPIKKGTKLTVDQNYYNNVDGADDYLSNLEYYRIKGTNKWVNLPDIKKSTRIMPNNFVIAPVMVNYVTAGKSAYLYNINGEIVDKSYLLIPDVNVGVDRALYIWNKQTKQADLYYHLTANKKWSGFHLLME
ncbi:SLAP domain-containing protein [Lactobacillus crispatus]|uniref:SLAP domain-containing protein n=1 Tax=Lactobacillus crispatus TaxID=47770 RepID=UPI0021512651|nr:SLAP domain-containing protein [Lactobacillus crispatus]